MKEIGADSLFAPSGLAVPISSNCRRWLLDVELDLSNSLTTLEAVQWAICELQRMELQERYSAPEALLDQRSKADADADAGKEQKGDCRKGSEDPALGNRSGIQGERDHGKEPIDSTSPRSAIRQQQQQQQQQQRTEQLAEVRRWRTLFQTTGKRKSDEEDSGGENGKRTKTEPVVCEVDHAEAGKRMAKRIGARLAVPDCISLTNLVSHCLLVSMDQVPPIGMEVQLGGSTCAATAAEAASGSKTQKEGFGVSNSDDWLWLHKWLVKTCLSDVGDDDSFASLDWLIALMTAACQSLIEPILDDLVLDLERRESQGSVSLAAYIRRAGVLEYAARRWDQ